MRPRVQTRRIPKMNHAELVMIYPREFYRQIMEFYARMAKRMFLDNAACVYDIFANIIGKAGADFKREYTVDTYKQFFSDAGYTEANPLIFFMVSCFCQYIPL